MHTNDILTDTRTALAELEALRIEINLDKPRRGMLQHMLAAQEKLQRVMLQLETAESLRT